MMHRYLYGQSQYVRSSLVLAVGIALALIAAGCGGGDAVHSSGEATPDRLPEPAISAELTNPLEVGDEVPAVEVRNLDDETLDLSRVVAEKPTVIIFYRGGWCPYCNTHLGALAEVEPRLLELGYQVLAISADRPGKVQETREEFGFGYRLLSDAKMRAARALGIAFHVAEATLEQYEDYGIRLEEASGQTHHLLPVPSVFIAGTDGVIRFAHSNPDYKVRLEPEKVVAAAEEALEKD